MTDVSVGWELAEDGSVVRVGRVTTNEGRAFAIELVGIESAGSSVVLPHIRSPVFGERLGGEGGDERLFLELDNTITGTFQPPTEDLPATAIGTLAVERLILDPRALLLSNYGNGRQTFRLGKGFSREGTIPFLWTQDYIAAQYLSRGSCS